MPDAVRGVVPKRDGIATVCDARVAPLDPPRSLKKSFEGQAAAIVAAAAGCSEGSRRHAQRGKATFGSKLGKKLVFPSISWTVDEYMIYNTYQYALPPGTGHC